MIVLSLIDPTSETFHFLTHNWFFLLRVLTVLRKFFGWSRSWVVSCILSDTAQHLTFPFGLYRWLIHLWNFYHTLSINFSSETVCCCVSSRASTTRQGSNSVKMVSQLAGVCYVKESDRYQSPANWPNYSMGHLRGRHCQVLPHWDLNPDLRISSKSRPRNRIKMYQKKQNQCPHTTTHIFQCHHLFVFIYTVPRRTLYQIFHAHAHTHNIEKKEEGKKKREQHMNEYYYFRYYYHYYCHYCHSSCRLLFSSIPSLLRGIIRDQHVLEFASLAVSRTRIDFLANDSQPPTLSFFFLLIFYSLPVCFQ